jgi:glycosyltransferase involved in cell wall biosynthesis
MNDFINNKSLSVCMITYGHESYIEKAIEGVLQQICDFNIELIIANDCSPDCTDTIIANIIQNHPKGSIIKYYKNKNNIGMMPNFIFALKQCKGKYIALCEGDDYWTDNLKLQKQVDFLEANSDYVLCFHQVAILKSNGTIVDDFITKVPDNHETIDDLARHGNYIHTPSVVYRNIIKEFPSEFKITPIGDFFLYMILAEYGKLKYLTDIMCVYRHGIGVFSSKTDFKVSLNIIELFSCLLSSLKDKKIKKIILERQFQQLERLEKKYLIVNNNKGRRFNVIKNKVKQIKKRIFKLFKNN